MGGCDVVDSGVRVGVDVLLLHHGSVCPLLRLISSRYYLRIYTIYVSIECGRAADGPTATTGLVSEDAQDGRGGGGAGRTPRTRAEC